MSNLARGQREKSATCFGRSPMGASVPIAFDSLNSSQHQQYASRIEFLWSPDDDGIPSSHDAITP